MLVWESCKVRAIAGIGAPVVHRRQAFVFAYDQAKCVIELLAVIELAALEHLLEKRSAAHARMIEILIPKLQVLDGGVQAGRPSGVEVSKAHPEGLVFAIL